MNFPFGIASWLSYTLAPVMLAVRGNPESFTSRCSLYPFPNETFPSLFFSHPHTHSLSISSNEVFASYFACFSMTMFTAVQIPTGYAERRFSCGGCGTGYRRRGGGGGKFQTPPGAVSCRKLLNPRWSLSGYRYLDRLIARRPIALSALGVFLPGVTVPCDKLFTGRYG
jgi:hypothetical protein